MPTTTTLLELVLALTALSGLVVAIGSLLGSVLRRRAFQRDGLNGLRMIHATANIVRDAIRLFSALVLLAAAGVLLSLPSDTDPDALVSKSTLVLIGWCLLANTLTDALARRRITRAIEALESVP